MKVGGQLHAPTALPPGKELQVVKKFCTSYGSRKYITVFKEASHF